MEGACATYTLFATCTRAEQYQWIEEEEHCMIGCRVWKGVGPEKDSGGWVRVGGGGSQQSEAIYLALSSGKYRAQHMTKG